MNPEEGSPIDEPFQGYFAFNSDPRVLAALEPWAEVSERLRRYSSSSPPLILPSARDCSTIF